MEIAYKRDDKKPYVCDECGKSFAWDKNSWKWGKLEYETIQEQREIEKLFCSTNCKNEYLKKNNLKEKKNLTLKINQNGKSQN